MQRFIKQVSESTMDGDTATERWLNALLTSAYIGKSDLPSDECLSEAREIVGMFEKDGQDPAFRHRLARYLAGQFSVGDVLAHDDAIACEILFTLGR
jgi:hypothetical protein